MKFYSIIKYEIDTTNVNVYFYVLNIIYFTTNRKRIDLKNIGRIIITH